MTADEFADRIEHLIADEVIIVGLEAAVEALDEGMESEEGTK